jgi:hypothetical protein
MMESSEFRAHLRRSALSNFAFNFVINAGLAWWLLSNHERLTTWGEAAYGPDLLVTGFLLSALVMAIVMEIHRRQALRGGMASVALASHTLQALSRRSRWSICLVVGALGAMLSVLPLAILAVATPSLSVAAYAGIKGLWAGILAAAIVAPATLLGLELGARQHAQGG